MIFAKKEISLDELKEKDPEAFNKIMEQARASVSVGTSNELAEARAKIEELTKAKEREAINANIRKYGVSLGVMEVAEQCITKELSFSDALVLLADANIEYVKKVADSFEVTASAAAGITPESDVTTNEPSTFGEAIVLIKKRDNIPANEAAEKAKVEFKELFDSIYDGINKVE